MSGVNKVIIIGNLTSDPDVKTLQTGTSVANFSLAINESYKDRDGKKVESVEFVNVVLWHGLAEVAGNYLKKGSGVYVEGKLKTSSYEKDGVKKYKTEVVGFSMNMLPGNSATTPERKATNPSLKSDNDFINSKEGVKSDEVPVSDDLPF